VDGDQEAGEDHGPVAAEFGGGSQGRVFFFLKKKEAKKTLLICGGVEDRRLGDVARWIASLRSQ
jgi:hypothetical protein